MSDCDGGRRKEEAGRPIRIPSIIYHTRPDRSSVIADDRQPISIRHRYTSQPSSESQQRPRHTSTHILTSDTKIENRQNARIGEGCVGDGLMQPGKAWQGVSAGPPITPPVPRWIRPVVNSGPELPKSIGFGSDSHLQSTPAPPTQHTGIAVSALADRHSRRRCGFIVGNLAPAS